MQRNIYFFLVWLSKKKLREKNKGLSRTMLFSIFPHIFLRIKVGKTACMLPEKSCFFTFLLLMLSKNQK